MSFRFFLLIPLCLILSGCGSSYCDEISLEEVSADQDEKPSEIGDEATVSENEQGAAVFVYVCGNVNSPGVYELPAGSRIFEALALAGGLSDKADVRAVNQAETCYDGEMIYIPAKGEETEADEVSDGNDARDARDERININTADSDELQRLKGIGRSRAEDIISYREKNGSFSDIESIMKVPGIKQGTFDRIKDQIKV